MKSVLSPLLVRLNEPRFSSISSWDTCSIPHHFVTFHQIPVTQPTFAKAQIQSAELYGSTFQTSHPASVILRCRELCLDPHCTLRDPTNPFDTGNVLETTANCAKHLIQVFHPFRVGLKHLRSWCYRYLLSVTGCF